MNWPIHAALRSGQFERTVVSTDDVEIAKIAVQAGAEIPFMRDTKLSDDMTGTSPVIVDAIRQLNLPSDTIVACIYPTAVFLTEDIVEQGVRLISTSKAKWAFTVCEFPAPIQRAYMETDEGLRPVNCEAMPKRSQDLLPRFFDAGQIYFARASTWLAPDAHTWDGAAGITLPWSRCVDIDTAEDWNMAEMLFAHQREQVPPT
jgi:N-acylneuraminate cytidylyltransferase